MHKHKVDERIMPKRQPFDDVRFDKEWLKTEIKKEQGLYTPQARSVAMSLHDYYLDHPAFVAQLLDCLGASFIEKVEMKAFILEVLDLCSNKGKEFAVAFEECLRVSGKIINRNGAKK